MIKVSGLPFRNGFGQGLMVSLMDQKKLIGNELNGFGQGLWFCLNTLAKKMLQNLKKNNL